MKLAIVSRVAMILVALLCINPAAAGDLDASRTAVEHANAIWMQVSCRLRIPVELKKARDRNGWSKSPWMCTEASGRGPEYSCYRVFVSDRGAISQLLEGDSLRPGVGFVSQGWSFDDSDAVRGLRLDLRFTDLPVYLSFRFTRPGRSTSEGFMSAERIRHIESHLRGIVFDLGGDGVTEIQLATPTSLPSPTPLPTETPVPTPRETPTLKPVAHQGEVRITAIAVRPSEVRAGAEVRLVIAYDLLDLPSAATVEVVETRRITAGARVLATFSESLQQSAGTYTSELPVRVPSTLEPGLYSLEATVALASGITRSGSGVFTVVSGSD